MDLRFFSLNLSTQNALGILEFSSLEYFDIKFVICQVATSSLFLDFHLMWFLLYRQRLAKDAI